ncbi:MAG: helix-turn-helix transcriptional regulator, partial [Ruminococcaceae bacterium]|nr:helix-turn-helix transcriptional regulator [Oscillospiraceae bacterium]
MQSIGDRIRLLRIDRKLTQKELAQELGIGYSTIQGYEQGLNKLSKRGLRLLSTYFNVSEDYLLGKTN